MGLSQEAGLLMNAMAHPQFQALHQCCSHLGCVVAMATMMHSTSLAARYLDSDSVRLMFVAWD